MVEKAQMCKEELLKLNVQVKGEKKQKIKSKKAFAQKKKRERQQN